MIRGWESRGIWTQATPRRWHSRRKPASKSLCSEDFMSNRYSWLSWQPIHMSRWLNVYLMASVPIVLIPVFLLEMHHNGGRFVQSYRTLAPPEGSYWVAVILLFV